MPTVFFMDYQNVPSYSYKGYLRRKYTDSSSDAFKQLHWLPIRHRINFKLACIVFKCINNIDSPQYLKEMLHARSSNYSLSSIDAQARTIASAK